MAWMFAVPVIVFLVALMVGGLTRRVRLRSCCGVADPRRDLRMRDAFADDCEPAPRHAGRAGDPSV